MKHVCLKMQSEGGSMREWGWKGLNAFFRGVPGTPPTQKRSEKLVDDKFYFSMKDIYAT